MTSSPPQHLHGNDAQAKAQGVRLELRSTGGSNAGSSRGSAGSRGGGKSNGSVSSRLDRLDEWMILGDKIKLGQVMRNLISNALKFTPKGGVVSVEAPEVTSISTSFMQRTYGPRYKCGTIAPEASHVITLQVSDSGIGMTEVG